MWFTGVAIASIYGVISVLGLVGNITLIKTFCSAKTVRNVPNVFMSSLALGDVMLLVTCAPVDASRYLSEEWLFGRVGCKVIPFIQLTSVGVSVFTLTALSADRYVVSEVNKGCSFIFISFIYLSKKKKKKLAMTGVAHMGRCNPCMAVCSVAHAENNNIIIIIYYSI